MCAKQIMNGKTDTVFHNVSKSQTQSARHHLTSDTVTKGMIGERQIKFRFLLRFY